MCQLLFPCSLTPFTFLSFSPSFSVILHVYKDRMQDDHYEERFHSDSTLHSKGRGSTVDGENTLIER